MNDTLYLPLKAKYYDMIESGEKPEEYREIKPYWCTRIGDDCGKQYYGNQYSTPYGDAGSCIIPNCSYSNHTCICREMHDYKYVCFSYGYTKRRMTWEVGSIRIGCGNPAWGAPKDKEVFIIKLGKRIK